MAEMRARTSGPTVRSRVRLVDIRPVGGSAEEGTFDLAGPERDAHRKGSETARDGTRAPLLCDSDAVDGDSLSSERCSVSGGCIVTWTVARMTRDVVTPLAPKSVGELCDWGTRYALLQLQVQQQVHVWEHEQVAAPALIGTLPPCSDSSLMSSFIRHAYTSHPGFYNFLSQIIVLYIFTDI